MPVETEKSGGLLSKLREVGALREAKKSSDKSVDIEPLKEVTLNLVEVSKAIKDNTLNTVSALKNLTSQLELQMGQDKDQHDEKIENEKEKREDEKRKREGSKDTSPELLDKFDNFIARMESGFKSMKESFSSSLQGLKEGLKGGGGFLKKLLAIGALGFIFRDLIDEWTGGALTNFLNDIQGENGLFSQIKAAGIAIAGLGLLFAPITTLRLAFKGLFGAVRLFARSLGKGGLLRAAIGGLARSLGKGGLLRRGLSGFASLLGRNGAIGRGLSSFGGMLGRNGSIGRGMSGLGGRLSGLKNALGGRRGLIGALTAGAAAVATGIASINGNRTPTPSVPDADGTRTTTPDADGTRTTTPDADGTRTTTPDTPRVTSTPNAPSVTAVAPAQPPTPTAGSAAEVLPRPSTPTIQPSAPSAPGPLGAAPSVPDSGAATIAGAAADAATPRNALSAADKLSMVVRAVGSAGLKSIPILGAGLGAIFAGMRAWQGDWAGAGAEAGLIFAPGPVGLPGDIALAVRDVYADMYQGMYGVWPWQDTPENREVRGPAVMEEAEATVRSFVDQQDSGMYPPGQLEIQSSGRGRNERHKVIDTATGEELQSFGARNLSGAQQFIEDHTMTGVSSPEVNVDTTDDARAGRRGMEIPDGPVGSANASTASAPAAPAATPASGARDTGGKVVQQKLTGADAAMSNVKDVEMGTAVKIDADDIAKVGGLSGRAARVAMKDMGLVNRTMQRGFQQMLDQGVDQDLISKFYETGAQFGPTNMTIGEMQSLIQNGMTTQEITKIARALGEDSNIFQNELSFARTLAMKAADNVNIGTDSPEASYSEVAEALTQSGDTAVAEPLTQSGDTAVAEPLTPSGDTAPPTPRKSRKARIAAAAREKYQESTAKISEIDGQIKALGQMTVLGQDEFFGDDIMGFDDPEKQAAYEKLSSAKFDETKKQRAAGQEYAQTKDRVVKTTAFGQTRDADGLDEIKSYSARVEALKDRGFTDEQLGRNDNLANGYIDINGARYPMQTMGMYDNVIKQELMGESEPSLMQTKTASTVTPRYNQVSSQESVNAASPGKDVASAIMPVMQSQITAPRISKGDTITNNFFTSRDSGIDPASPLMGR